MMNLVASEIRDLLWSDFSPLEMGFFMVGFDLIKDIMDEFDCVSEMKDVREEGHFVILSITDLA